MQSDAFDKLHWGDGAKPGFNRDLNGNALGHNRRGIEQPSYWETFFIIEDETPTSPGRVGRIKDSLNHVPDWS